MDPTTMAKLVALCRDRGLIFQSSEIYGRLAAAYDYGHYGVLLKDNVKDAWRRSIVRRRDVVALGAAILMHPATWEASGHTTNFSDPMCQCAGDCKKRFRADHLDPPWTEGAACPNCGGPLGAPQQFNLMFETQMGAMSGSSRGVYLRPETAQGIFVNFKEIMRFSRRRPPFGVAQIGKSFRNEITPGNFIFRTCEFEQMELEFFVPEDSAEEWYQYWLDERLNWYVTYGIRPSHLRLRHHDESERAHYAIATADVEYNFPIGWSELEGIANRGSYDLRSHQKASGQNLEAVDPDGNRSLPYVIEPSAGADRAVLAFLADAYDEDELGGSARTVLRLHPQLAPVKLGVFPHMKKDGLADRAEPLYDDLANHFECEYDAGGAIGKRYRRHDEIGTPWCATVDHQTLDDGTVTLRDRDSGSQERVSEQQLGEILRGRLAAPWRPGQ